MTKGPDDAQTIQFAPRRDAWLVVLLCGIPVAMLGSVLRLLGSEAPLGAKLVLAALLLGAGTFSLWSLLGTGCQITADALQVRVGPLRWRVAIDSILEVAPDRNLIASASLSYERLRIRIAGGSGDLYVSPRDRDRFLECIAKRSRRLQRRGDRLISDEATEVRA